MDESVLIDYLVFSVGVHGAAVGRAAAVGSPPSPPVWPPAQDHRDE